MTQTVLRHPVSSSQLDWFQHSLCIREGWGCSLSPFFSTHSLLSPLTVLGLQAFSLWQMFTAVSCSGRHIWEFRETPSSPPPPRAFWALASTPSQGVGLFWVASLDNLTLNNFLRVDSTYHVKRHSWEGGSISVWSQHSPVTQNLTPKIQEPFLFVKQGRVAHFSASYLQMGWSHHDYFRGVCVCVCVCVCGCMYSCACALGLWFIGKKKGNLEGWSVLGKILWLLVVKSELKPRFSDSGRSFPLNSFVFCEKRKWDWPSLRDCSSIPGLWEYAPSLAPEWTITPCHNTWMGLQIVLYRWPCSPTWFRLMKGLC